MYVALVLKAVEPELDSSRRLLQRDQWERADSSVWAYIVTTRSVGVLSDELPNPTIVLH
jgi:hypothetical protein